MPSNIVSRRFFIGGCANTAISLAPLFLLHNRRAYSQNAFDTIGEMAGGGNFYNDQTPEDQYAVLDAIRARAIRMSVFPGWYSGSASGKYNDNAVLCALQHNANILYQCEYLSSYPVPQDRSYDTWFHIGRNLARRYSPGSSLLTSRGIPASKGVTRWSAINEPDRDQSLIVDYRNIMRGYANGIHSIDPAAKVYPGGYLSTNRDMEYTGHGYIPRIVDLINGGVFSGIDIHIYADRLYAPIHNTWRRSAQHDFDRIVSACGISRKIDLLVSEHNFKNSNIDQGYDESHVRLMMLPHIFDVLGCVHKDNTPSTKMALAWDLFFKDRRPENYLTNGGTDWRQGGMVYKMVLNLLGDCHFVFNDPRATGRYELTNSIGSKYVWVFQNHHRTWSTEYGPWRQIDVRWSNSILRRYNHDGLKQVTRIKAASLQRVTTPTGETSIWIAQPQ